MDRQAKFKAQTKNNFFTDGSADRLPVTGTVLRGTAIDSNNVFSPNPRYPSTAYTTGKKANGEWVQRVPAEAGLNMATMRLGKENMTYTAQLAMVIMLTGSVSFLSLASIHATLQTHPILVPTLNHPLLGLTGNFTMQSPMVLHLESCSD